MSIFSFPPSCVEENLPASLILYAGIQRRRPSQPRQETSRLCQLRRQCPTSPLGNAAAMRRNPMAKVVDVMPPHKRVKGGPCNGNLEVAWSGARVHRTPDTEVPTNYNEISKEAGCGAEGLATPNVRGVYHHSLLGPSFQQGWVVTTAQRHQLP
jgi:hypothetical protein